MKRKKVAIYSGTVPSTTFIERLIEGLAHDGVGVYLFGSQFKKVSYAGNVRIYTHSGRQQKLYMLVKYTVLLAIFKITDKRKLDRIIADKKGSVFLLRIKYYPVLYHKPDIFHLQWAKSIEDWIWVQEFGMKLILSLRGAHINYTPVADPKYAVLYKNLFPKVNGFHAVSKEIAREAAKYNADLSKIKIIYSGLDLEKLKFNIEIKTPSVPIKIISIGRSHWKKGYVYALDAFRLLKKGNFDFQYTIVGVGDDEELIFQRAQLDLQTQVDFKSNLSFENVLKEIQSADILLLPSVEEGIANVVLEAMALGTLVISTNCGGMEEVITNGENGFIVPVRNPEAIVSKFKFIASLNSMSRQSIRNNARKTIEKQHSNQSLITGMQELYSIVLEDKV